MADISLLRKKLVYRSWHRGCKEIDVLLGYFALKYLNKFSLNELIEYEKIVDLDDYELYCYIIRKASLPPNLDSGIMGLITCFVEAVPVQLGGGKWLRDRQKGFDSPSLTWDSVNF